MIAALPQRDPAQQRALRLLERCFWVPPSRHPKAILERPKLHLQPTVKATRTLSSSGSPPLPIGRVVLNCQQPTLQVHRRHVSSRCGSVANARGGAFLPASSVVENRRLSDSNGPPDLPPGDEKTRPAHQPDQGTTATGHRFSSQLRLRRAGRRASAAGRPPQSWVSFSSPLCSSVATNCSGGDDARWFLSTCWVWT